MSINIEKSPNDSNQYRFLSLDNKIQILLISSFAQQTTDSNPSSEKNIKSYFHSFKNFSSKSTPKKNILIPKPNAENMEEIKSDSDSISDSESEKSNESEIKNPVFQCESQKNKIPGISSVVILVETGSANEPKEFHGLAHLLEHVIFLGSKEYPEPDSFTQFIWKHGGSDNGKTGLDHTIYDFSIENQFLSEGLYRFSRLLKNPLFPENGIDKEIKSINNEFELALTHDGSRHFQILINETDEKSKYKTFSWGNSKSLNYDAKKLRKEVLKYFKNFYLNEKIKICVFSKLDLDEMEKIVRSSFSDLTNGLKKSKKTTITKSILSNEEQRARYSGLFYVESAKGEQLLIISWALKPLFDHYRSRPIEPIENLLNEEGPNSLYFFLKREGYINSLTAYLDEDDGMNELFFLFTIEMDLTEKGLLEYKFVLKKFNEYLFLIKSYQQVPDYYLNQLKTLSDLDFLYSDEEHPSCMAEKMVWWMTFVRPEELLLVYSSLFLDWNQEIYQEILNSLQIEKSRITLMISNDKIPNGVSLNEIEPWFGTKYKKTFLDENFIKYLKECEKMKTNFKIPEKNPYIPTNTTILCDPIGEKELFPSTVFQDFNNPIVKCWHYFDLDEKKPKICCEIIILYKNIGEELEDQANLEFFVEYFTDIFNETIGWQSSEANICVEITDFQGKGLSFSLSSYSEQFKTFLDNFFLLFTKVCLDKKEKNYFNQIKERIIKDMKNFMMDSENQLSESIDNIIFPEYFVPEKYIEFLEHYTIETFENFCKNYLSNFYNILSITLYFHGNLYKDHAKEYSSKITDILKEKLIGKVLNKGLHTNEFLCKKILILPGKKNVKTIKIRSKNSENPNFLMVKLIDIGKYDIIERNKLTILNSLIAPQFYEILRMQKSIGYLASTNVYDIRNRLFLVLMVNSSNFNDIEINKEIENFLNYFVMEHIEKMSEIDFKNNIDGIIANKLEKIKNLRLNCSKFWSEIVLNELIFDRINKNVEILKSFSFSEIKIWIKSKLINQNNNLNITLIPNNKWVDIIEEDTIEFEELIGNNRKNYNNSFDFDIYEHKFFK